MPDLENMEVIGQIYVTKDYSIFKLLEHNRAITDKRIEKLTASFREGIVLCPIVCNKNMEIVDGQGRFFTYKKLDLPVPFIIDEDAGIEECRRMNAYSENWTSNDYVDSYAEEGDENYQRLKDVQETTGETYQMILRYINKQAFKKTGHGKNNILASGELTFTEQDAERAIETHNLIKRIVDALAYTGKLSAAFKTSVAIMRDAKGFNTERMIARCRENRSSFVQMARLEDMLTEFSRIYNFRAGRGEKIFFQDYMRSLKNA
jgi:hypothetical protein